MTEFSYDTSYYMGLGQVISLHIKNCNNVDELRSIIYNGSVDLNSQYVELYINNNNLEELCELPERLIKLNCANNKLSTLPILPINLKELYIYGNNIRRFGTLPPHLKTLYIDIYENTMIESLPLSLYIFHFHNCCATTYKNSFIESQSFDTKKSLVYLLNQASFQHNLTENDINVLDNFREKQKNVANFYRISMPNKNYHDLSVSNRTNVALRAFCLLSVSYKIVEYL